MTDDDASYFAETMTEVQRSVIALCSKSGTLGYTRLAEKLGITYPDVQQVGTFLQAANLATIKLLKPGYNGSGIFLNDRGEQVKAAALRLERTNAPNQ